MPVPMLCNTAPNLFYKYYLAACGKMWMHECGCQMCKMQDCRAYLWTLCVGFGLGSGLELGSG